jgi:transglutaminase-like putative cysteine protease
VGAIVRYRVRHRSTYAYSQPVDLSYHMLRLSPRALPYQVVHQASVTALPAPAEIADGTDYFGNGLTFLSLVDPHEHMAVEMRALIDVAFPAPPDAAATPAWEAVRDALRDPRGEELIAASEFRHESPLAAFSDEIVDYAALSFPPGRPLLECVLDLTRRIHRDFAFDPEATVVTTPLVEVMQRRRGVCQDFAHLEIAALRGMGLAARYVSGYIRTYRSNRGPNLAGADASHAWVSVFCPGAGWIDVDPTNDLVVREEHIVLAWGRDYSDVSPIRGVILGGGEHALDVVVEVVPAA